MGKGNKGGKGNAGAAVVAPVAPVVPAAVMGTTANGGARGAWAGYTVSGLCRAAGYAGYTPKQVGALLPAVGMLGVSPSTVQCQCGAGRQYANGVANPHHRGAITPLAGAVLAAVVAAVGQPANPLPGDPAPLPAPRVPGVVPAPVAPVAPVAPAKPRKRKGAK